MSYNSDNSKLKEALSKSRDKRKKLEKELENYKQALKKIRSERRVLKKELKKMKSKTNN